MEVSNSMEISVTSSENMVVKMKNTFVEQVGLSSNDG